MQYVALWLSLKKRLSPLSVRNDSVMLKIFHRHGKMHSFQLTWLHHMGMGPQWWCETAGRQWCMFLYFCLLTLEEQLTDRDTLMSVYYKDNIVQDIAFNLSVFEAMGLYIPFTSLTLLFLSLFLHVHPEGKIRHEMWKQALQSSPPSKSIEGTCKPGANAKSLFYQCVFHDTSSATIFQNRLKNTL